MIQVVTLVSAVPPGTGIAVPQCPSTGAGFGLAAAGCAITLAPPDSTSETLIAAAQASAPILILLMAPTMPVTTEAALKRR